MFLIFNCSDNMHSYPDWCQSDPHYRHSQTSKARKEQAGRLRLKTWCRVKESCCLRKSVGKKCSSWSFLSKGAFTLIWATDVSCAIGLSTFQKLSLVLKSTHTHILVAIQKEVTGSNFSQTRWNLEVHQINFVFFKHFQTSKIHNSTQTYRNIIILARIKR